MNKKLVLALAALSPAERALLNDQARTVHNEETDIEAQLQAQLASLPPEERTQAEAAMRQAIEQFQSMSPEEQAAVLEAAQRAKISQAVNQARDACLACVRGEISRGDVVTMLEDAAAKMKANEKRRPPGNG